MSPEPDWPEPDWPEPDWIDSHCHLPNDDLVAAEVVIEQSAAELVQEAQAAGLGALIDVGTTSATSAAACARAASFEQVFATVGLHPHHASEADTQLAPIEALIATTAKSDLVAVGECGLDYYYENSDRSQQQKVFAAQIELANKNNLALVIHSRSAWDDTFAVLDSVGVPKRTVFHCFTGGVPEARKALERGAAISFSGIVSFKNAAEVREAAAYVPAGSYLIETDSPYLAPVPNRGKINRPAWVTHVGQAMADARGVAVSAVATETHQAATRMFGLMEHGTQEHDPQEPGPS